MISAVSSPGRHACVFVMIIGTGLAGCGDGDRSASSTEMAPAAVLARANDLARRHRVVEALEATAAYVASRPVERPVSKEEAGLWEKRAALLLNASRPQEAAQVLTQLRRTQPFGPRLQLLLADSYLQQGAYRQAVDTYEELPPKERLGALLGYAKAVRRDGHPEEGAAIAAAALIRDPWLEEAYLAFGRAGMRLGNESLAEVFLMRYRDGEAYRQADREVVELEFRGLEAPALLRRARAELERGRLFEAMHLCNQALKVDQRLADAYLELARLSLFLERPWDAIPQLEKLPPHARVLAILAAGYEATGDIERARQTYDAALEKDPGRLELKDRLENLRRGDGLDQRPNETELDALRRDVRGRIRKKRLSDSVPELLLVAESYARFGEPEEARKLGLFLVRVKPRDFPLRLKVARLFRRPRDAFIRLWLLTPNSHANARAEYDRELGELGLRPDLVRRALQGENLLK